MKTVYYALLFAVLLFSKTAAKAEYFTEIAPQLHFEFQHHNGGSGAFFYPEIVGSGVALLDFDNDGDLDIYMVQSGAFETNEFKDKLFENSLNSTGNRLFKDVTLDMKMDNKEYGIGAASADVNNDGWVDLYITNLHGNQLLINNKGKSFKPIDLNEPEPKWSTGASFCDVNNDGLKDLYVANYVNWSITNNPKCFNKKSKQDYCGPNSFNGVKDVFYINDSSKGLVERTELYFPNMPSMPGLNVICTDVNNDGWNDFIVANDGKNNLLWLNQEGKSFKENGLISGLAVNGQGLAEASMGVAINDFDIDGDLDVFFTHLMNESNTLYQNNAKGIFQDVTNHVGLSTDGFAYTGWSASFVMVNKDIFPDLIIFNGAVADSDNSSTDKNYLSQPNKLNISSNGTSFTSIDEKWLTQKFVSRGAAFGDIDNDGDIDIVINNNNDKAQIHLNNLNPKEWVGLIVSSNKYTNLRLLLSNKERQFQINTNPNGSYAASNDPRVIINEAQLNYFNQLKVYNGLQLIKNIKLSDMFLNDYQVLELN